MSDASPLILTLSGTPLQDPGLPSLLRSASQRGGAATADPFLPPDYLRVVAAYDLTAAARSSTAAVQNFDVAVGPEQVLVLELPDGGTLITTAERFEADICRAQPDLAGKRSLNLDDVTPRSGSARGWLDSLGGLVSRVFVLDRGGLADAILDEAIDKLREWAGDALADKVRDAACWGISYLSTRALMWAIERRLLREPGLYRWMAAERAVSDLYALEDRRLVDEAKQGPLLVFIHGTGSSTTGSFGDLRGVAAEVRLDWDRLQERYGERIYGFEHRTFSESPIENALLLARTLPAGAQIDLVTHSRGGIVGDLLAIDWSDIDRSAQLIDGYQRFRTPENAKARDLQDADARDRRDLLALASELRAKRLAIRRYVRVAAPVNGTLLAGSNLDLFLSGLLSLTGFVTTLQASPCYQALKRIVLEIVRNRTDPNRVPGLEAMLPGSAASRLLRLAAPQPQLQLGVIAGDSEGAPRFQRLVELLADWTVFQRHDNDLVVDTASMSTGLARQDNARRLFVQGPQVDHFHYFGNADSRGALAGWLTSADPVQLPGFEPLAPAFSEPRGAFHEAGLRGGAPQPVVIVLPGIMGSHLQCHGERVWFDPLAIVGGGLTKLSYTPESLQAVSAERLFEMFYGALCRSLATSHRVIPYPYDWRRPLKDAADGLEPILRHALDDTRSTGMPVRILAHSMGGLVTRRLAAASPELWDEFLEREGSRFLMLGTPNQGSHQMVEMLLGKGDMVRKLAMLDARHDLQQVLDLVSGFRGALQLLPRPGFRDGGTPIDDYYQEKIWRDLKKKVFDAWFGDGRVGVPAQQACAEARELWDLTDLKTARLPGRHPEKILYVCGKAPNTPCGISDVGGRIKMLGTPEGDGAVTWASGRIEGIGQAYLMEAKHGDLANTQDHFDTLAQLLADGSTTKLSRGWPSLASREAVAPAPIVYDAGPASIPSDDALARSLLVAGEPRPRHQAEPIPVLRVQVTAMDLRYSTAPILVGHYERDPISGAEYVIDRDVVANELTIRKQLGLYPGPIGSATVVLVDQNDEEKQRGSQRGALVTGLGEWGDLNTVTLTRAVCAAALRYLLAKIERSGGGGDAATEAAPPLQLALSSVLLGFASTTNISVADSLQAIVRGVLEANRQFAEGQPRRMARIERLQIVEQFLDVAITASRELPAIAARLSRKGKDRGFSMRIVAETELTEHASARPRLEVQGSAGYWPRLIVTDATPPQPSKPAESLRAAAPERLKYVFLSQRARAEAEVLQSQPGMLETLVRLSIHNPSFNADLSRTLFQLMVPLGFKEAARQTDSLALLVDEKTANLPWELLVAGEEPMAIQTAMVRQLASVDWRPQIRSANGNLAYVVGNPSTQGFSAAFFGEDAPGRADPPSLPAAEAEAYAVSRILRASGYQVVEAIGSEQSAIDVLNQLFQRPYRILHIAAHGEFALQGGGGQARTGVLLSDGLMLTAAEIVQMEIVPDLVFLNCCHLGTIDQQPAGPGVEVNKLAASLARELIKMGVRAVVVAGWAVDDRASQCFAEVFYGALLAGGQPFGPAVHEARLQTWRSYGGTNTWGAFQAYGDPGFLIDPTRLARRSGDGANRFVAPQELVDQLEQLRESLKRPGGQLRSLTLASLKRDIAGLLSRSPESWGRRGDVNHAIAAVYADFGRDGFAEACAHYQKAIDLEEDAGRVPIKAIEQLANLEVRSAETRTDAGAIAAMRQGAERLERLIATVSGTTADRAVPTPERCALAGGSFKRIAEKLAEQVLAADSAAPVDPGPMREALKTARSWYQRGEGQHGQPNFHPYCALNRLAIDGLLADTSSAAVLKENITLAGQAGEAARSLFPRSLAYWDAMMPADAGLIEAMFHRELEQDDASRRQAAMTQIVRNYRLARASVLEDARSWNSVTTQIEILCKLAKALNRSRLASSLEEIAGQLKGAGAKGAGGSPAADTPAPPPAAKRKPRRAGAS